VASNWWGRIFYKSKLDQSLRLLFLIRALLSKYELSSHTKSLLLLLVFTYDVLFLGTVRAAIRQTHIKADIIDNYVAGLAGNAAFGALAEH